VTEDHPTDRQRRAARAPLHTPVAVRANGSELACESLDLSTGGISLVGPSSLAEQSSVWVRFNLGGDEPDGTDEPIESEGTLLREESRDGRLVWCVVFNDDDPSRSARILDYVRAKLREGLGVAQA